MWIKLFLLPLLLAAPEVAVNWASEADETITVSLPQDTSFLKTCVKSGLEMQYETDVQLCKRRPFWFDTCQDYREQTRLVHYDAISRNYEVVEFWDAEKDAQTVEHFSSLADLKAYLSLIDDLSLSFVARFESEYVHSQRSYVSVRVRSHCKGEANQTLEEISQVLTLGLFEMSGFDTGWIDFRLRSEKP